MNSATAPGRYEGLFESPLLFLDTLPSDDGDQALIDHFAEAYDVIACVDGQGMNEEDVPGAIRSAITPEGRFELEQRPWLELTEEMEQGLLSGKRFLLILDKVEEAASPWTLLGKMTDFAIRLSRFCRVNSLPDDRLFLIVALNGLGGRLVEAIESQKSAFAR